MTYKDVVDSVALAVRQHKILRDFGYGAITDIKTVATDSASPATVDYPYVFLNPTQGSRNGQSITYRWNLISMDVVQEDPDNGYENYLRVQSECQQYIDDILAFLRFESPLKKFDLTLNVQLTPFKERFQDSVAGMTATLEVEVPQALNNCITPFVPIIPPPPDGELQLSVASTTDQLFRPDQGQSPWRALDIIIDTQGGWRDPAQGGNFYIPQVDGTWNWVFEGQTRLFLDAGDWPSNPEMVYQNGTLNQPTSSTWPATQPSVGVDVPFRVEWTGFPYTPNNQFITWNWINDPQAEDEFYILAGTTLKGYFTPA